MKTRKDKVNNNNNNDNRPVQPNDAYLLQFPDEVLLQIYQDPDLDLHDQYALSLSCRRLNILFFKECEVKIFLTHVVRGELAAAKKMIEQNPNLLLEEAIVIDEAGRKIYGTALRIALGAKDVCVHNLIDETIEQNLKNVISNYEEIRAKRIADQHEEMVEMLEGELKKLPNGEEIIAKQRAEQFPEGWEQQEEERIKKDSAALKKVFADLKEATTAEDCGKAVKEFQDYLKEQTKTVIKTGYHFNEKLYEEAVELYQSHSIELGTKSDIVAVKVIGGIECYFTACLADAACNGFGKTTYLHKPLPRTKLLADKTPFFSPKLGLLHFIYSSFSQGVTFCGEMSSLLKWDEAECFKEYVEKIHQALSQSKIPTLNTQSPRMNP